MAALAPRPLQVLVEDPGSEFDNTGAYLGMRYRQLGVADRFGVEKARAGDDWPKALRIATVQWFHAGCAATRAMIVETDVMPEAYSALNVTPKGSLRESKIGRPIYAIIRERASKPSAEFDQPN